MYASFRKTALACAAATLALGDALEAGGHRLVAEEVQGLKITRVRIHPPV